MCMVENQEQVEQSFYQQQVALKIISFYFIKNKPFSVSKWSRVRWKFLYNIILETAARGAVLGARLIDYS